MFFNNKLGDFHERINGKRIAVIGLGVSHKPLVPYLLKHGSSVTVFDKSKKEQIVEFIEEFEPKGVNFKLGDNYLEDLTGFDIIFRTPGVRPDIEPFRRAIESGAILTSEIEVFLDVCPAKIYSVTGSDGKTTTTTIISEMLKKQGYKVWLGGNIGDPLLYRIDDIKKEDVVVMELSSFQLMNIKKSPDVSIITNISPNHLDYHTSMDEYVEAKKNLFMHQNKDQRLVVNYDNEITKKYIIEAKGECILFSRKKILEEGVFVRDNDIYCNLNDKEQRIMSIQDIKLMGDHNIENYLAAISAVMGVVGADAIKSVAKEFSGVSHRLEFIRELNGVSYYNDSIASSPSRTIAGLKSFEDKVILIAGGCDKKIDYGILGESIIENVKKLILIGQTAPKIEEAYKKALQNSNGSSKIDIWRPTTYEEAVKVAYGISQAGDKVVLSPASTSFDMFKNFEERGCKFKELVNKLPF